ncbi:MAG: type 4a pilus biogenesis protein PilO [Deltaproteobacteria bacterium]|nr:type 4a pilus biogenesis protein PilO [Deltaproteobacteria bacterium]
MNGDVLKALHDLDLSRLKVFKGELIALLGLFVFSVVFYRFGYMRNAREISALDGRIEGARAELGKTEAEARASANLEKTAAEASVSLKLLEDRLKNLKERLPSDKQVSRLLAEFSGTPGAGIRIVSIKPLAPEDRGELSRLPFQITMEARFIPFGDYLERVEKMPRLMIVDNFMVEPKDDSSAVLRAQVYLSAYMMNYGR